MQTCKHILETIAQSILYTLDRRQGRVIRFLVLSKKNIRFVNQEHNLHFRMLCQNYINSEAHIRPRGLQRNMLHIRNILSAHGQHNMTDCLSGIHVFYRTIYCIDRFLRLMHFLFNTIQNCTLTQLSSSIDQNASILIKSLQPSQFFYSANKHFRRLLCTAIFSIRLNHRKRNCTLEHHIPALFF